MNVEQRQAAADPQTKPPDLSCQSAYIGCYRLQPHRHLLLLRPVTIAETNASSVFVETPVETAHMYSDFNPCP